MLDLLTSYLASLGLHVAGIPAGLIWIGAIASIALISIGFYGLLRLFYTARMSYWRSQTAAEEARGLALRAKAANAALERDHRLAQVKSDTALTTAKAEATGVFVEVSTMKAQIAEKNSENDNLKAEIEQLSLQKGDLIAELDEANAKIKELLPQLEIATGRLELSQKEIELLKSTSSSARK